jgi:hypothetical protein
MCPPAISKTYSRSCKDKRKVKLDLGVLTLNLAGGMRAAAAVSRKAGFIRSGWSVDVE